MPLTASGKEDPIEMLRRTRLQREIREQATEVTNINKKLFINNKGKAEIARYKM